MFNEKFGTVELKETAMYYVVKLFGGEFELNSKNQFLVQNVKVMPKRLFWYLAEFLWNIPLLTRNICLFHYQTLLETLS